MNNEESPSPLTEAPEPLDVIRKVFQDLEFLFEEADGFIRLQLTLQNMEVKIICWGSPGDVASLVVKLPIRANEEYRLKVGEFLHRLNYGAKRKFWEMDFTDGEIRVTAYTDTINCPLSEGLFRAILHTLTTTADTVFPYLTSVMSGRMTPEFAADQAEAAIQGSQDNGSSADPEPE